MDPVKPEPEIATGHLDKYGRKEVFAGALRVILLALTLFLSAWTLDWPAAWVFIAISALYWAVASTILIRTNPVILNVRGRKPKETKKFDKIILAVWMIASSLGRILAGLDYGWFHWSEMPLGFSVFGFVILAAGGAFIPWAMAVNANFEVTVRIQDDRGHRVCKAGPYRFIRHPGYTGIILAAFGGPLLLGSWPAVPFGAVAAAVMVWRTAIEDRILIRDLDGYAEFTAETRYRLAPGLW